MSAFSHGRLVAVAVLCLMLTGIVAAAASATADLAVPLATQWVQSMKPEPANLTTPVVLGDRIFVVHDGALRCLDPATGGQLWQLTVKDQDVVTAPLVWQNLVIVGTNAGLLLAVKADDHSQAWKVECGGFIASDPTVIDGVLIVGSERFALALDPATGHTKWACSLTSPARYGPLTDGARLYFRCQDGSLQSVDMESGRFRWRVPVPSGPLSFPPVMAGNRVLVVDGATLRAIARSGLEAYTSMLPVGIGGPVAVVEDTLYVPCVDGQVYTLGVSSGRAVRMPEYRVDGSVTARPLVTDTELIVGTSDSMVYVLDRATGDTKWSFRCRAPEQFLDDAADFGLYAPLLAENGVLYALDGSGDLFSFTNTAPDVTGPQFSSFDPTPGDAIGDTSLSVSFAVYDDGCGVDPASVAMSIDGKPAKVKFDAASGVATALFSKPEDTIHLVKATAADYRGNAASKEWSFLTDASLTVPEEEGGGTLPRNAGTRTGTVGGRTGGTTGGTTGGRTGGATGGRTGGGGMGGGRGGMGGGR
jgi:outer membrane protein assembly factor BamB